MTYSVWYESRVAGPFSFVVDGQTWDHRDISHAASYSKEYSLSIDLKWRKNIGLLSFGALGGISIPFNPLFLNYGLLAEVRVTQGVHIFLSQKGYGAWEGSQFFFLGILGGP